MCMVEYHIVVCAHDAISARHNSLLVWYNQQAHENLLMLLLSCCDLPLFILLYIALA